MKWFGRSWGAPVCDPEDHVSTPDGTPCERCKKPVGADDQGFVIPHLETPVTERPWHLGCFLASVGVESKPAAEQVIHVLDGGVSICGMPGLPKDWPEGHRWVRINEAHMASCEVCKACAGCA